MVEPIPSGTVDYTWDTTGCYVRSGDNRRCFSAGQMTQTVIGNDLLAHDSGTITCSASIDSGPMISSQPFTIRISGNESVFVQLFNLQAIT